VNTYIMLGIVDGLILILLGCLFLGRKKCIYRQSYDTIFVILILAHILHIKLRQRIDGILWL